MKRTSAFIGSAILLLIFVTAVTGAEQMRLTSDTLEYDPERGVVTASGNVRVTGRGAEITSLEGEFDSAGMRSLFRGRVLVRWEESALTMDCEELQLEELPTGQTISAVNVTRFHDPARNVVMRGDLMKGTVRGGVFTDLEAAGNVVADAVASGGGPTRMTGRKAVYSRSKETLVFSGDAVATQEGRKITADTFVIHLKSGRIEAVGNPRMIVDLPPQESQ